MAKLTRDEVINERRCGLKFFDLAAKKLGRAALIEEGLRIHREFPDIWGGGWSNIGWAMGNAVIDFVDSKSEFPQTWNLDEALTPEELDYIRQQTGVQGDPETVWPRRKPPSEKSKATAAAKAAAELESGVVKLNTKKVLQTVKDLFLTDVDNREWLKTASSYLLEDDVPPGREAATVESLIRDYKLEAFWGRLSKKKNPSGEWIRHFQAFYYGVEANLFANSGKDDVNVQSVEVVIMNHLPSLMVDRTELDRYTLLPKIMIAS